MGRPINKRFFGADDNITATATYDADGNTLASATVNTLGSGYVPGDTPLTLADGTGSVNATLTLDTTQVGTVAINAGGSGYSFNDTLTENDGSSVGTNATFTVSEIGTILSQDETVFDGVGSNGTFVGGDGVGGTSYAPADTITLSDGTVVTVDTIDGNGDVVTFDITTASTSGTGSDNPTLTQSSTSGTGTAFTLTLGDANQEVFTVTLATGGSYTTNPALLTGTATTGGTGTGATVDITMGAETFSVANAGSYSVNPTTTNNALSGGSGAGATADLTMNADGGTPSNVTITNGGAGYDDTLTNVGSTNGVTFDFTATGGVIQSGAVNSGTSSVLDATGIAISMPTASGVENPQILGTAWIPGEGAAEPVYIVRQRSSRKFEVASVATPSTTGVVKTVNGPTATEGEFVIPVSVFGGGTEYAKIITGRKVRTFDGNSYKWGDLVIDTAGEGGVGTDM